jgi:CRISPR system Cascade subunit CasA
MNLINDRWIQVVSGTGESQRIAPAEIVSAGVAPVDLQAPRPDFRAALYQFLIGLLQTAYAPADIYEWRERWESPPSVETLQAAFTPLNEAFELDSSGPAFMQDYDLGNAEPCGIGGLLIDAPGSNTVELNKDHFVHRDGVQEICPACAAAALFTLQINAPSGGAGHRVSLRGGGPLTTLRIPSDPHAILYQKLWANVIPKDRLNYPSRFEVHEVLPWMAPTRTSDAAGVGTTEPVRGSAHPLQAYFSCPRRIRLDFSDTAVGSCDLCGDASDSLVQRYRTRNYGVNYAGAWVHPLSPYSYDPKQNDLPISLKGQRGGIGYRHWLALTLGGGTVKAAKVVSVLATAQSSMPADAVPARLWAFGADFDNAKVRCWYDATLPLYAVTPERLGDFGDVVRRLLDVADEAARALNRSVKEACSGRPAERVSDPAVAQSFWQASEAAFYALLQQVARADLEDTAAMANLYELWLRAVRRISLEMFDQWVLAVPIEDMKMERVVTAKAALAKSLNKHAAAELWQIIRAEKAERV